MASPMPRVPPVTIATLSLSIRSHDNESFSAGNRGLEALEIVLSKRLLSEEAGYSEAVGLLIINSAVLYGANEALFEHI